jgi:carbamoyl-phosphate synthase small subunit
LIKKAKKSNSKISQISTGVLVLENKKIFRGIGIGYQGEATGEVCFNTSLTGYQEIISDPSYAGQIINFTFPHIGMLERIMKITSQIKYGLKELYLTQK